MRALVPVRQVRGRVVIRITDYRSHPALEWAFDNIPRRVLSVTGWPDIFMGNPVYAGLHSFRDIPGGRSYEQTAHCAHEHAIDGPADRRRTTIVLPSPAHPVTVVHELGHVLHERLRWDWSAVAVDDYGRTDVFEAFAQAFTFWILDPENELEPRIHDRDLAFFRGIGRAR